MIVIVESALVAVSSDFHALFLHLMVVLLPQADGDRSTYKKSFI